jgi:hypothetical protein
MAPTASPAPRTTAASAMRRPTSSSASAATSCAIRGIVNDDDTTLRRITSIGWVGDKRSKIIVVTRRNAETGAADLPGHGGWKNDSRMSEDEKSLDSRLVIRHSTFVISLRNFPASRTL